MKFLGDLGARSCESNPSSIIGRRLLDSLSGRFYRSHHNGFTNGRTPERPSCYLRGSKGRWHVRDPRHRVNLILFSNISLKVEVNSSGEFICTKFVMEFLRAVSYTHLTLPTIYSV